MMPTYKGQWNLKEDGVLVVEKGKVYDIDEAYADWLNKNSPGVVVLVQATKGAPANRMVTHTENRGGGPRLPETIGPSEPEQQADPHWELRKLDATPGAIKLATETGFDLSSLEDKGTGVDGRILKKDVEEALS